MRNSLQAVIRITGGAAFGQLILILATVASTRLFEPAHLGVLGLVTTIAAMGEVLLGGRLDLALPVAGNQKQFSQLSHLLESISFNVFAFGFVLSVIIVIWSFLNNYSLTNEQIVAALAICASALALRFDSRIFMAIRARSFGVVGKAQAVAGFSQGIFLILGGLIAPSSTVAAISFLIGRASGNIFALRQVLPAREEPPAIGVVAAIRKYKDFPKYAMPTGFVNSAIIALPVTYSASFFSVSVAGVVFVVWRLLVSPTQLLGRSIGQVVYGELAHKNKINAIYSGSVKALWRTSSAGLLIAVLSALAGLFVDYSVFLGEKWEIINYLLAPIGLIAGAQLAVSPLRNILTTLGMQSTLLKLQLLRLLTCIVGLVASATLSVSVHTTFWIYAASILFSNFLLACVILKILSNRSSDAHNHSAYESQSTDT